MKSTPILMNGPMVRATLDDSKTQTRRAFSGHMINLMNAAADIGEVSRFMQEGFLDENDISYIESFCPYGQPGDRLWVRETFFAFGRWETRFSEKKKRDEWHFVDMTFECDRLYQYAADNPDLPLAKGRSATPGWHKRPAIFMLRVASRITLEIVSVRIERLQDISETDAIAEGVEPNWCGDLSTGLNGFGGQGWVPKCGWRNYMEDEEGDPCYPAADSYRSLWESINGAGSWDANPWVWVVEFKRMPA